MKDEGFIPWAQIAPLMEPGMTWRELGHVLEERLGMSAHVYGLLTFSAGVRIVKRDSLEFITAPRKNLDAIAWPR